MAARTGRQASGPWAPKPLEQLCHKHELFSKDCFSLKKKNNTQKPQVSRYTAAHSHKGRPSWQQDKPSGASASEVSPDAQWVGTTAHAGPVPVSVGAARCTCRGSRARLAVGRVLVPCKGSGTFLVTEDSVLRPPALLGGSSLHFLKFTA